MEESQNPDEEHNAEEQPLDESNPDKPEIEEGFVYLVYSIGDLKESICNLLL
jgi:hypothetical protein